MKRLIDAKNLINAKVVVPDNAYALGWNDAIDAIVEYEPTALRWIPVSEQLPKSPGIYLVTILTRELKKTASGENCIAEGEKPPRDQYWDHHSNVYAENLAGFWVEVCQRVFHDGVWSGYMETVIAWMPMPEPYTEEA